MIERNEAATGRRRGKWNRRAVLAAPLAFGLVTLGGCSRGSDAPRIPAVVVGDSLIAWPAQDIWPAKLLEMPEATQVLYRDVAANKPLLQYIPCYCNCSSYGHTSVYDCYVASEQPDGSIQLDTMGFG